MLSTVEIARIDLNWLGPYVTGPKHNYVWYTSIEGFTGCQHSTLKLWKILKSDEILNLGKHTIFARVTKGMDVLKQMNRLEVDKYDRSSSNSLINY